MYNLRFVMFLLLLAACSNERPKSNGTFEHQLSYYKYRPLETLLSETDEKLVRCFYFDEPPGRLSFVNLYFTNEMEIQASFGDLHYVQAFNPNMEWDFELLKKETVVRYELIKPGKKR